MALIKYYESYGRCGGGATCEMEFSLTAKEREIYDRELKRIKKEKLAEDPELSADDVELEDDDLDCLSDVPELAKALERAEKEVMEYEMSEYDNEELREDLGEVEMDIDKLNELVHNRDPHALKFFKLEKASKKKIEEWDADELDEIPLVKDFEEDFKPNYPCFRVYFAVEE